MRVLFVSPKRNLAKGQAFPPLGILSIAAVLKEAGHEVKILDRDVDSTSFVGLVKTFDPEIIGFSTYTGYMLRDAIEISQKAKKHCNAKIIWGGVHPSLLAKECLQEDYIDIIILGEGEYAMLEVVNHLENNKPLNNIQGIGFRENGHMIINQQTDFIDLNSLPIPAWDLIDVKKYYQRWVGTNRVLRIYSSKGCPNRCGFCYNWAYHKSTWRGKSTDKLIEEIKYLVDNYRIKGVGFTDDLFTFDTERLVSFCDRLIEEGLKINWYCNARVGLDRPELQKMKDAGCKCIYFGIESGSKNIHKLINKGISIEKIHKTFELCKQLGISTVGSFIIGFPDETEEDIKDTVNLAMALKPTIYDFSIYKCYPGTHLYDYSIKNGLFKQPESMEDWIDISSWDKSAISFSKLSNNELEALCDFFTFKTIMNSAVHDTNTIIGYINLRKVVEVFVEVSRIVLNIMKSRKVLKKYSLI